MEDFTVSNGKGREHAQAEHVMKELTHILDELQIDDVSLNRRKARSERLVTAAGIWRSKHELLKREELEILRVVCREIDRWRANEGREIYNSRRRKVRKLPNFDLQAMSDEEARKHRNFQKADSAYRRRRKKAGDTESEIKTGLLRLHAKRSRKQQQEIVGDES